MTTIDPTFDVSRRRVLQAGAVSATTLGFAGVAAANRGRGTTTQTRDVLGPSLVLADDSDGLTDCEPHDEEDADARPLYESDGARLRRNPNSISARVSIDTPEPGTYCYPDPDEHPTAVDEEGPPEAFTLWLFTFDEEQGPFEDNPWSGAFFVAGHPVGGSNLNLSGQISKQTEPVGGFPLEDPGVEVHLAVAPHGALDPDLLPDQIKTPAGIPGHWWVSIFEDV